jgi:hypothetical protein
MHEPGNFPMNWTIAFDEPLEIIRATVSGKLTADGIKLLEAELIEESRRRDNYRCLCDCRGVGIDISLGEIYDLPEELRALGVMSYHMVAVLHSATPEVLPFFTFFDDRCYNVGLSQKTFSDYDLACLWLTGIDWSIVSRPTAVAV